MIFYRKIYNEMRRWKEATNGTRALLIEGARRIGKSTIVEQFAKSEYKSYILIDFSQVSSMVLQAFEEHLNDLDTFFMLLSVEYGVTLYKRDSVIIFDEVQLYPKARQSIKTLVKDGRYDYIETGSLISIKENVKDILIPSEERKLRMYPMDFEEFCIALGAKKMTDYIRLCYSKLEPLEESIHKKAMLLLKEYMLVGGMPMSVAGYIQSNKGFHVADAEKRDILSLYKADISKADLKYRSKVASIFEQIPSFLSKHEKRIRLSNIDEHAQYPLYQDTFFWLSDSMMTNECYNCCDPNIGLALNEDRAYIKCYMGDTGLLISHTFSESELNEGEIYKYIMYDKLSINEGMFFENLVAQSLVAKGYPLYFYTHYDKEKHRNDIEIDFLISNGNKVKPRIIPIEVKSTKRYTTTSLERFISVYGKRIDIAYIVSPKNLSVDKQKKIVNIPVYMVFCL